MRQDAWPTVEEVEQCESVYTVLRWNRFLPEPMSNRQVAVIEAVVRRLAELRARDRPAYIRASKALGW